MCTCSRAGEGLSLQKRYDIIRRRRAKRNYALLNEGYKEEEEEYEAEAPLPHCFSVEFLVYQTQALFVLNMNSGQEEEFQDGWRQQSILEDLWKAEYYRQHHRKLQEASFP